MAAGTTFQVDEIFDLASRVELIVVGTLLSGRITIGDTLRTRRTSIPVEVLSIEFPGARVVPDAFTLLVEKGLDPPLEVGDILETWS